MSGRLYSGLLIVTVIVIVLMMGYGMYRTTHDRCLYQPWLLVQC